jgi:hypothetical protein
MLQNTALTAPHARRTALTGVIVLAALVLALFAMRPGRASAGLAWCASDPIISVNGQLISVAINVPVDEVGNVDEAQVTFHVPSNVDARVVFVDQSFFPERARIVKDQAAWNGRSTLKIPVDVVVESEHHWFPIRVKVLDATGQAAWYDGMSDWKMSFTAIAFVRPF